MFGICIETLPYTFWSLKKLLGNRCVSGLHTLHLIDYYFARKLFYNKNSYKLYTRNTICDKNLFDICVRQTELHMAFRDPRQFQLKSYRRFAL